MITKIVIILIEIYRKYLSPLKIKCCRFYPSCSEYAISAIKKHGLVMGIFKSTTRILRCNPLTKGGYDPA